MKTTQQLITYEQARGDSYRLLAVCFYQPDRESFLQEGLFDNLSLLLRQVCPDAAVFSDKMGQSIMNCSSEELLVDYSRLFLGPYELIAAPYGSVYLEEGKKLMGESTMEALRMYRDAGLSIDEDLRELPDHIAVELEFMYYLIYKEIEALKKSDYKKTVHFIEAQEEFHSRLLGRWVRPFCDKITAGTDNEFYIALAGCLFSFVLKPCIPGELKSIVSDDRVSSIK